MDVFVNENEENIKPICYYFFISLVFGTKTFLNCSLANTSLMRSITSLVLKAQLHLHLTNLSAISNPLMSPPLLGETKRIQLEVQLHYKTKRMPHFIEASFLFYSIRVPLHTRHSILYIFRYLLLTCHFFVCSRI